jgi:hypothetical protein
MQETDAGERLQGFMEIRYPESDQITDPTPKLPASVAADIQNVIIQAVARWRTSNEITEERQIGSWAKDAVLIFNLLAIGRLEESYPNVDALREVLNRDAEMAMDCVHWIYKLSFRGRMALYYGHRQIERRLGDEAETIVTKWWVRKAHAAPDSTPPAPPSEVNTDAEDSPATENARLVQEFMLRIYKVKERRVRKVDISNAAGYSDPTMLRWFEGEHPRLTGAARENFSRVLNYTAEEFWRCVDEYRSRHPR